jgi:RimJ/RimL family protein N-acetyltransferase
MIIGQSVALTELRRTDSETLFWWINDPETVRFNAAYSPIHESGHLAWFDKVTTDPSRIVFGIRRSSEGPIVGVLQLVDIHPVHRSAELIIRIGEKAERGLGFGSEAVKLAIDFAFEDRNLQRVWLRVFSNNERAIRAYQKAGLAQEGLLRRACFIGGDWLDEVVMAKLSSRA